MYKSTYYRRLGNLKSSLAIRYDALEMWRRRRLMENANASTVTNCPGPFSKLSHADFSVCMAARPPGPLSLLL
jgi:hypothetical protein